MEKIPQSTASSAFSLADFIGFLLFQRILQYWVISCQKFYYKFMSWLQSHVELFINRSNLHCMRNIPNSEIDGRMKSTLSKQLNEMWDAKVSREDVEVVMRKMGMLYNPEGEELKACFGSYELSVLFEEKEPSLEEVKEAFSVFDENGDQFIEAKELQRALSMLGFREGSSLEACERMIRAFDENGDGRIDFNEFLKFMESSFC